MENEIKSSVLVKMENLSEALRSCNMDPVVSLELIAEVLNEDMVDMGDFFKKYIKLRKKDGK